MEASHEINRNVPGMGTVRPNPRFAAFADDLRGGDDWLEGGDGNDYISTGQGSDVVYGGKGNDVLTAYGTLSTDVCYRQPVDLITTQQFYYKIAGSDARIPINHPRLAAFDFEIRQKPTTDASGELVFRNVGQPSPSLEACTELALKLGDTQGVERGESVALNALPNADFGKPIGYPFQLASNSAFQATGQKGVRLWGGSGNDILYGAGDSDKLYGEADNDVLVDFGGDDELYGGDGIKPCQHTTNSIALYADSMPAKCLKGLKNRAKTSKHCNHRKYKPNQHVAGIATAYSATEFVVSTVVMNNASEVQHG